TRLRSLVGLGGAEDHSVQSESFSAWRSYLEALAETRPLVLVFEDLHWADDGLLDFVDQLADWARSASILVLCTARPELLERRPLQDAAVVGKVFWLGSVCSIGGVERGAAEASLLALERKELVQRARRSSVEGEAEHAFRHLLVRDVAYGQIPRADRVTRHRAAAAWVEALGRPDDHAEMLASH